MDELLRRQGASLEFFCTRSAVLEGDLVGLQAAVIGERKQAMITDGDAVDIRGKIFRAACPLPTPLQCTTQSLRQTLDGTWVKRTVL